MIRKKTKYESVVVTVPNASVADVTIENANYTPDKDYKRVTGVKVSQGQPGSVQNAYGYVLAGLRDSAYGTIIDDQHWENLQSSAAVRPDDKFLSIDVPCDGRKLYPRITPPSVATAAGTFVFTFRLEDEQIETARI